MSVMVAVALSGTVAVAVTRLLTNQARTMQILELREQRMQLLRHYRDALYVGWFFTSTGRCGAGNFCSANGGVLIPRDGLYLRDNLYDYGSTAGSGKWWKVSADRAPTSKYAGQAALELTVEFLHDQHPVIKTQLKPVTEAILLP